MIYKKWIRPVWVAAAIIAGLILYVAIFKASSAKGFAIELSNAMFMWGLILLCYGLIYVTRFFGYIGYFQAWFRLRPFHPKVKDDEDEESEETRKRDPFIIYASLILIVVSILITL